MNGKKLAHFKEKKWMLRTVMSCDVICISCKTICILNDGEKFLKDVCPVCENWPVWREKLNFKQCDALID